MKTPALLYIGLGLIAGSIYGDELRRRKTAETHCDDLTQLLEKITAKNPPPERQFRKMAVVPNDAHKHISAVSKALLEPVPQPQ